MDRPVSETSNGLGEIVNESVRKINQREQEIRNLIRRGGTAAKYDPAKCNLRYHVHFRAGVGFSEQFCAIFDAPRHLDEPLFESSGTERQGHVIDAYKLRIRSAETEKSMLIRIPKFIQEIQRLAVVVWPKRLCSFDDCARLRVDTINHAESMAVVIPIFGPDGVRLCLESEYRESGSTFFRGGHYLPHRVFKCGARVTYDFTDDKRVMDGEVTRHQRAHNDLISLRLTMQTDAILLSGTIGFDFLVELAEVVLSPIDLGLGALHRIRPHSV
jgi:hypothetical protein